MEFRTKAYVARPLPPEITELLHYEDISQGQDIVDWIVAQRPDYPHAALLPNGNIQMYSAMTTEAAPGDHIALVYTHLHADGGTRVMRVFNGIYAVPDLTEFENGHRPITSYPSV